MRLLETPFLRVQRITFVFALLVAALVVLPLQTAAAEKGKLPDLRGEWKTTYATPTGTGRVVREARWEITRQEGELLWGVDVWHPIDPETGKALEEWVRDPLVGSLDPSGDRGLLATKGVQFAFRLVGPDELEVEMASFKTIKGFPPTAFYAVMKRGAAGAVSRTEWPDLSGSWRGPCTAVYPDSVRPSSMRLDFVRQDGELLWMDDVWSPTGPLTDKTDPKTILRDRMLGSFNPTGTGGLLVKEGVRVDFRLLSPDRMAVEFIRIGGEAEPSMVFYTVLEKGGEETPVPVAKGIDLVGVWKGSYRYALPDRPVDVTSTLVFTGQEGNAVWAQDIWTQPGSGGAAPIPHSDPMAGSLSPDQTHGAIAKPGAYFKFRMLDADHLEFAFTGVGAEAAPTAFFGVFSRTR